MSAFLIFILIGVLVLVVVEGGVKPKRDYRSDLRGESAFIKVHLVCVTYFQQAFVNVPCHVLFVVLPIVVRGENLAVVRTAFDNKLFAHVVKAPSLYKWHGIKRAFENAERSGVTLSCPDVVLTKPRQNLCFHKADFIALHIIQMGVASQFEKDFFCLTMSSYRAIISLADKSAKETFPF